jgi:hypothetical protein
MNRKIKLTLVAFFALISMTFGQTKMVVGEKHTFFVDIPKNWLQAQNDQLVFFIKPNEKNVSDKTYIYALGLDYKVNPDINGWIDGNTKYLIEENKGLKIDSLTISLDNIKKDDYMTGRYKVITYEYEDKRKEALLIVECKNTIVTIVLSTKDKKEFEKYLASFNEIAKSLKILGTTLKSE